MKQLTKKQLKEIVIVHTYKKDHEPMTREKAIKECREWIDWSEGCERERYTRILLDLLDGETYCTDGE